jgi:hypothetical protein
VGVAAAEANHPGYGLGHLTHALLVGVYGQRQEMENILFVTTVTSLI